MGRWPRPTQRGVGVVGGWHLFGVSGARVPMGPALQTVVGALSLFASGCRLVAGLQKTCNHVTPYFCVFFLKRWQVAG